MPSRQRQAPGRELGRRLEVAGRQTPDRVKGPHASRELGGASRLQGVSWFSPSYYDARRWRPRGAPTAAAVPVQTRLGKNERQAQEAHRARFLQAQEREGRRRCQIDTRFPQLSARQWTGGGGMCLENTPGWTGRRFHLGTNKEAFDAEVYAVYQALSIADQRQEGVGDTPFS